MRLMAPHMRRIWRLRPSLITMRNVWGLRSAAVAGRVGPSDSVRPDSNGAIVSGDRVSRTVTSYSFSVV